MSVVDIDKEDNYKDIYVQFTSESDCFSKGICYHYQGGKKKNSAQLYGDITYFYIKTADGKEGWVKDPKKTFFIGRYDGTDDWNEYAFQWG